MLPTQTFWSPLTWQGGRGVTLTISVQVVVQSVGSLGSVTVSDTVQAPAPVKFTLMDPPLVAPSMEQIPPGVEVTDQARVYPAPAVVE